jgi:branched-chain amino acid transport system permease protein
VTILQGLLDGVLLGGVYAVVAIGLTLLLGVVDIVNFAHGAFVMAGAYVAYVLYTDAGIDPYVRLIVVAIGFFLIGVVYYAGMLRRLVGQSLLSQSLLTIGVSLILVNGALAKFGPETAVASLPYSLSTIHIGALTMTVTRLVGFGVAVLTTLLLYLLLWRTDFGVQVRASAVDRVTAELMGINSRRVQALATGLSVACAGIGGVVLFPILYVAPTTADQFIFLAFLIVALGGLGSFWGALLGGLLIGVVQSLGSTYFDGSIANMLIFVIFVLVVIVRPNGLFGRAGAA